MDHNEVITTRPDLVQRELELEAEAADISRERAVDAVDQRGLATGSVTAKRSLRACTLLTGAAIGVWMTETSLKRNKPLAYGPMDLLTPDQLAFIVSRIMIDNALRERSAYNSVVKQVGLRVQQVIEYGIFEAANKGLAVKLERQLETIASPAYRRAVLSKAYKAADFERITWDTNTLVSIGHILVNQFMESSGLFVRTAVKVGKKTTAYIVPTLELELLLATADLNDALVMPFHYPMVIPPKPWTNVFDGGYLDQNMHAMQLVKTTQVSIAKIDATDLSDVLDAVNAIQSTAWQINGPLLDVLRALNVEGLGQAGLTSSVQPELPVKPWGDISDDAWVAYREDPANADIIKASNKETAIVHGLRTKWISKRLVQSQQVAIAERFVSEGSIYFPHVCDFRGRVYPTAGLGAVNPQGNDAGKALLQFADAKPLGPNGGHWLAIHCANVWGADKLAMEDRVLWAEMNSDMMLACAKEPLVDTEWQNADKPFNFLAACFEWAGYVEHGEHHLSRQPIALDGTCSGLQHFAAMARDQIGAEAVNVVQVGNTPSDLYARVVDAAKVRLATESDPLAKEWTTRLIRFIAKQPCMTTPYGVTAGGIRDQVKVGIAKCIAKGDIEPFTVDAQTAAAYLTPILHAAIGDVVGSAGASMEWLKHVAKVTSKSSNAISWETPNGFTVIQDYRKSLAKVVKVSWAGQVTQLTLLNQGSDLDAGAQVRSIAPNFVHSMDACHLMVVAANMRAQGITSFAFIHDSFGTHACDTDVMAEVLREAFIAIYSGDALMDLYDQVVAQVDAETAAAIELPPVQGSLDVEDVRVSRYFFA